RAVRLPLWPPPGAEPLPTDYEALADRGYRYGPAFRGLRRAWSRGEELFAEVELPEPERAAAHRYALHPALLDAALHAIGTDGRTERPFAWPGLTVHTPGASAIRVRLTRHGGEGFAVTIADPTGAPVASAHRVAFRPADPDQLRTAGRRAQDGPYRIDWTAL